MKFPSYPQRGGDILRCVVEILNYLRATRVIAINGMPPKESPNGSSFAIKVGGNFQESKSFLPLTVLRAPSPDNDKVIVTDGYVNETLVVGADASSSTPTIHEGTEIWLKATLTFSTSVITDAEIVTTYEDPEMTGSSVMACFKLADVEIVDEVAVVTQLYTGGNLGFDCFGAQAMWWRI